MVYELNTSFRKTQETNLTIFLLNMYIFNINELNFRISIALIIFFYLLFKDG